MKFLSSGAANRSTLISQKTDQTNFLFVFVILEFITCDHTHSPPSDILEYRSRCGLVFLFLTKSLDLGCHFLKFRLRQVLYFDDLETLCPQIPVVPPSRQSHPPSVIAVCAPHFQSVGRFSADSVPRFTPAQHIYIIREHNTILLRLVLTAYNVETTIRQFLFQRVVSPPTAVQPQVDFRWTQAIVSRRHTLALVSFDEISAPSIQNSNCGWLTCKVSDSCIRSVHIRLRGLPFASVAYTSARASPSSLTQSSSPLPLTPPKPDFPG